MNTTEAQKEHRAQNIMGFSVFLITLSIIPLGFTMVQLLASKQLETPTAYRNILISTPIPIIAIISAVIFTIALLLAGISSHIAPENSTLHANVILVTFGWFLIMVGTLALWFIYTEKILRIDLI